MRWSIVRLIWLRELRDQLRDRRTVFMIVGLPLLIYPALGAVVLAFAFQFFEQPSRIGVPKSERFEFPAQDLGQGSSPLGPASAVGAFASGLPYSALAASAATFAHVDYPPLVRGTNWCGPVAPISRREAYLIGQKVKIVWLEPGDTTALANRTVDVVLKAEPGFYSGLDSEEDGPLVASSDHPPRPNESAATGRPTIKIEGRPDDDHSRQAQVRVRSILDRWKSELKKVRFVRGGLDASFDDPFAIAEPKGSESNDTEKIGNMVIRIFPFMLVMWSLAGALYPAVDLCAGEKERGTMETLLISPAGREEIVLGKFLTIWMFSAASALLNLMSMGLTTWQFSSVLPEGTFQIGAIFWCVLLSLPLSALFSAVSLAVGAYARSSKEGQYYLMPMFLVTMPLVFLTLAPGVELNAVYSLIPVTGVALLMQKLMTSPSLATAPWLYFIPVLAPVAIYSGLALRWAIDQFQREEVLFREAERIDLGLWFRHLLREKDATATCGQAYFCFALLVFLKWISMGLGTNLSPLVHAGVSMLAFVAFPTLLMAVMLNTRPTDTLALRRPGRLDLAIAALLAFLTVPPILWGSHLLLVDYPHLANLFDSPRTIARDQAIWRNAGDHIALALLVFALLPAVAEELAFRGFILTGLKKRYRPRTAIFLAAFMNALFHMNVFVFLPVFGLAVVQGLLTVRSRSLAPAIAFHVLSKSVLLLSGPLYRSIDVWTPLVGVFFAAACAIFWWLYRKPYNDEIKV